METNFDAFGWNAIPGLPRSETYGLDYESAREVTPRWYGVSFGNGNDGVSHSFPDYYVRTADPFKLAAVAMVASFKDGYKAAAAVAVEVDGEADYTIYATIYDPEDVEPETETDECDCEDCDGEHETYSSVNGAWMICEVFPVDEMPGCLLITDRVDGRTVEHVQYNPFGKPAYCTLEDAFSEEDIRLVEMT